MRVRIEQTEIENALRLRIRFDYKANTKKSRSLFRTPSVEKDAELTREQKAALLRNVPVQGINIEDIDMSGDVYVIHDEITGAACGYAPVMITFTADSIADALRFVLKEEFRKVEIIEPEQFVLSKIELERLMYRVNEEMVAYLELMQKKIDY